MSEPTPSSFDQIGGELALRRIIDRFVDRVYDDVMIGFFFRNVPKRKIQELEYQHAAEHLGGPVRYRGRPLGEAHRAHPIMGGQFSRRMQILREVLEEQEVPPQVIAAWLAHDEALRDQITGDGTTCNPARAMLRIRRP